MYADNIKIKDKLVGYKNMITLSYCGSYFWMHLSLKSYGNACYQKIGKTYGIPSFRVLYNV